MSGLSSGAFATVQLQIAYSSLVDGSAVLAGGMYYAAQGEPLNAISVMKSPSLFASTFETIAKTLVSSLAANGMIDPVENLRHVNSWLFAGTKDTVVHPDNLSFLKNFLQHYGVHVYATATIPAQHSFPTVDFGNQCDHNGLPFINACQVDATKELFGTLYMQPIKPRVLYKVENLIQIDQSLYIPPTYPLTSESDGINRLGYVYAPTNCRAALMSSKAFNDRIYHDELSTSDAKAIRARYWNTSYLKKHLNSTNLRDANGLAVPGASPRCAVHVAFHGCMQTLAHVGESYLRLTGFVDYAEANDIVIVFPQARTIPDLNPMGCFDWWGYSGRDYHTRLGVQPATFMNVATTVLAAMYQDKL